MLKDQILSYVDTHCHIHDSEFAVKSDYSQKEVLDRAIQSGVDKLICVGTSVDSSRQAVKFAGEHESCFATMAIHPHEVEIYSDYELDQQIEVLSKIADKNPKRLVAIGECGLDYFYHSEPEIFKKQQRLLVLHLELAQKLDLPLIFHIRDPKERRDGEMGRAFADFFNIFDKFDGVKGVIHSFSATTTELKGILERGLYVGLNGIMTFTTDEKQLEMARKVPLDKLVIETDSPFLTPKPLRGTINEPKHVILITQFLSELRGESQALLAKQTTKNAKQLFNL
jgi:TatD DNase family protein